MSDRFYAGVRAISRPLLSAWFRLRVRGAENLPLNGPCLVVANHASYLDPLVLGCACPRKIHFLISKSVFQCPGLHGFFRRMDTIPVSFEGNDPSGLRTAMRLLSAGLAVGIFPEGGRSRDGSLAPAKVGAALLAAHRGCPVVPAGIRGAHRAMPVGAFLPRPHPVEVVFGTPFRIPRAPGRGQRTRLAGVAERIMAEVAALVEEDGARSRLEAGR